MQYNLGKKKKKKKKKKEKKKEIKKNNNNNNNNNTTPTTTIYVPDLKQENNLKRIVPNENIYHLNTKYE
jgi:hypothetical protein